MNVAFTQSSARDAHEFRFVMEILERRCADITHRCAQAAGELMQYIADRALVADLTFDAFRHKLERVLDVLLEITVG